MGSIIRYIYIAGLPQAWGKTEKNAMSEADDRLIDR